MMCWNVWQPRANHPGELLYDITHCHGPQPSWPSVTAEILSHVPFPCLSKAAVPSVSDSVETVAGGWVWRLIGCNRQPWTILFYWGSIFAFSLVISKLLFFFTLIGLAYLACFGYLVFRWLVAVVYIWLAALAWWCLKSINIFFNWSRYNIAIYIVLRFNGFWLLNVLLSVELWPSISNYLSPVNLILIASVNLLSF